MSTSISADLLVSLLSSMIPNQTLKVFYIAGLHCFTLRLIAQYILDVSNAEGGITPGQCGSTGSHQKLDTTRFKFLHSVDSNILKCT